MSNGGDVFPPLPRSFVTHFEFTDSFVQVVRRWNGRLLGPSPENRQFVGVQVFKAEWFERIFAKAHPILPGVVWGPIMVACIYATVNDARFKPIASVFGFVSGVLAWTLIEYLLHRYVFHIAPDSSYDSKLKQFMVHGYHHEFPNDRMRLVAPLLLSVPIALVIAAAYFALFDRYHWMIWFAGTTLGYIAYDWVHYYTHHFRPTTRLGRYLRRYHMEHHYKDSDSHFGISSPLWDFVFGTAKSKGEASDSGEGESAALG
jgi:sterol desaturase/sphingolipid hydroxylase (fatty acid hydroxylase superfamily)